MKDDTISNYCGGSTDTTGGMPDRCYRRYHRWPSSSGRTDHRRRDHFLYNPSDCKKKAPLIRTEPFGALSFYIFHRKNNTYYGKSITYTRRLRQ